MAPLEQVSIVIKDESKNSRKSKVTQNKLNWVRRINIMHKTSD